MFTDLFLHNEFLTNHNKNLNGVNFSVKSSSIRVFLE